MEEFKDIQDRLGVLQNATETLNKLLQEGLSNIPKDVADDINKALKEEVENPNDNSLENFYKKVQSYKSQFV